MLEWYFCTHSWNRISLTGLIVAPAAQAIIGGLTVAHMIGIPIGAAVIWALGCVAIGGWKVLQGRWRRSYLFPAAQIPIDSRT